MKPHIILGLLSLLAARPAQSAPMFDAATHCLKDGAFFLACTRQSQTLPGTVSPGQDLEILQGLPQQLRLGYRFYCSNVTGSGDLEASLTIGTRTIGLSRTKAPEQKELLLYVEPGVTPVLEVGTTKRTTRLGEDCKFELTSSKVFPLTRTLTDISNLLESKKSTVDYLRTDPALQRSLGYLDARKAEWTRLSKRSQALGTVAQNKANGLEVGSAARQVEETKAAEALKAKSVYDEEISTINLVLANPGSASISGFVERLAADYEKSKAAILAYLNAFPSSSIQDEELTEITCSLNSSADGCGQ